MAHDLHFGACAAKVRATAPRAADVNRTSNSFLHRRRRASARTRGTYRLGLEQLLGAEFFADLGSNAR